MSACGEKVETLTDSVRENLLGIKIQKSQEVSWKQIPEHAQRDLAFCVVELLQDIFPENSCKLFSSLVSLLTCKRIWACECTWQSTVRVHGDDNVGDISVCAASGKALYVDRKREYVMFRVGWG